MLKNVTSIDPLRKRFGIVESLRMLKEAGFDGADLSLFQIFEWYTDTANFCKTAKAAAKELGMPFLQAHAPFPSREYGNDAVGKKMEPYIRRAIEVAGELEAGIIVVHPIFCPPLTHKEQVEYNVEFYLTLESLCREYGIKVALENIWGAVNDKPEPLLCSYGKDYNDYIDALPSDCFTACADIGHFRVVGADPATELRALGSRLGALHVHDNNGTNDLHALPFTGGVIDWDSVCRALADIDYKGHFTFEVSLGAHPSPLLPSILYHLAQIGRYFTGKIEEYKQNPSL